MCCCKRVSRGEEQSEGATALVRRMETEVGEGRDSSWFFFFLSTSSLELLGSDFSGHQVVTHFNAICTEFVFNLFN